MKITKRKVCIGIIVLVIAFWGGRKGLEIYQDHQCENKKAQVIEIVKGYPIEETGVVITHDKSDYSAHIYCTNFRKLKWDDIFEMDKKIRNCNIKYTMYSEEKNTGKERRDQPYYVYPDKNEIQTYTTTNDIEYYGSWENRKSENREQRAAEINEAFEREKDDLIHTKKCGICGKQATKRIDDEYYCDKHYDEAVEWYLKQMLK